MTDHSPPERIGFIGLGIMGQAMAANVLKKGYALSLYNRTPGKADELIASGARLAASPAQVAADSDVIILMLTGPEAVEAVLEGNDGLLAADMDGKTIIQMSTVPQASPEKWAAQLAEQGITLIDAPVSGSKIPAEQGTLVILAGGPEQTVKAHEELLLSMGKKVIYCGEAGSGSSMKLCINLLLGIMMQGLAEAVHLAEKSGLDAATLLDAVASGPLSCTLFGLKEEMLKTNTYPAQFPFKHMAKDMQFVMDAAIDCRAWLPLGNEIAGLFSASRNDAIQEMDFAAVKTLLDAAARND
ncbi:MAG: NAD(P)-dependent oxidoreductase [Mariprofundaceae bacterium]|nr:NAD(P)-dependent oxidoreductase [Mariprofundaceae bacterium]